ncbi:sulfatase [Catalinimonas niigatensis]|uniref:sulfatase n=1 Tax=Catalinimonas niigatensis TaxID=1397264 RepID=UPI0026667040|nr:sulfatase [Catalinimonas niigatensis]WPP48133.1 sulfatase [Catalinimonas niigatensis]
MRSHLNRLLFLSFLSLSILGCRSQAYRSEQMLEMPKPNILFIAVDDLRPELNCYGKSQIISPHIDQLAAESLVFNRAYCQVPVCGASRASLLTGFRPTRTRFIDYATRVDEDAPQALTLPQHLKDHGYYTISNGKIFHHLDDMKEGWSEAPWHPNESGTNWRDYVLEENIAMSAQNKGGNGRSFEIAEVADEAYFDGKTAQKTIEDLKKLAHKDQPFFLAAGFLKPHLPFNAPKKYWDLYDEQTISPAENNFRPEHAPDAAMHNWGELRNYADIPAKGPLSDDKAKKLVHGYYACISYTDAQIGKVLQALDDLGLADNTIVVLWGDHGWNLREHGLWCKHANFETSLRAPLMIKVPEIEGGQTTNALTEFVDIYPSLCELAGISVPHHLQGSSFVPLLTQPEQSWKTHTISKFHDGYTIKNDDYRYTEWSNAQGKIYARMLYDHRTDSLENYNIAEKAENESIIKQMQQTLYSAYPEELE